MPVVRSALSMANGAAPAHRRQWDAATAVRWTQGVFPTNLSEPIQWLKGSVFVTATVARMKGVVE